MADESNSYRFRGYEHIPAETIVKIVQGNPEAVKVVIDKYSNYMWVILRDLAHKRSLRLNLLPVDDIKQSVWVQFISVLKKFRFMKNDCSEIEKMFDSYCTKSLHHIIRDTLNRYVSQLNEFSIISMEALNDFGGLPTDYQIEKIMLDLGHTKVYLNDERLAEAISRLRPKYRKVIELAFFLGYTESDIAECLKIKKKSVYQYKYEAINLLKRDMQS